MRNSRDPRLAPHIMARTAHARAPGPSRILQKFRVGDNPLRRLQFVFFGLVLLPALCRAWQCKECKRENHMGIYDQFCPLAAPEKPSGKCGARHPLYAESVAENVQADPNARPTCNGCNGETSERDKSVRNGSKGGCKHCNKSPKRWEQIRIMWAAGKLKKNRKGPVIVNIGTCPYEECETCPRGIEGHYLPAKPYTSDKVRYQQLALKSISLEPTQTVDFKPGQVVSILETNKDSSLPDTYRAAVYVGADPGKDSEMCRVQVFKLAAKPILVERSNVNFRRNVPIQNLFDEIVQTVKESKKVVT